MKLWLGSTQLRPAPSWVFVWPFHSSKREESWCFLYHKSCLVVGSSPSLCLVLFEHLAGAGGCGRWASQGVALLGWALWERTQRNLSLGGLDPLLTFLNMPHEDQLRGEWTWWVKSQGTALHRTGVALLIHPGHLHTLSRRINSLWATRRQPQVSWSLLCAPEGLGNLANKETFVSSFLHSLFMQPVVISI